MVVCAGYENPDFGRQFIILSAIKGVGEYDQMRAARCFKEIDGFKLCPRRLVILQKHVVTLDFAELESRHMIKIENPLISDIDGSYEEYIIQFQSQE